MTYNVFGGTFCVKPLHYYYCETPTYPCKVLRFTSSHTKKGLKNILLIQYLSIGRSTIALLINTLSEKRTF